MQVKKKKKNYTYEVDTKSKINLSQFYGIKFLHHWSH